MWHGPGYMVWYMVYGMTWLRIPYKYVGLFILLSINSPCREQDLLIKITSVVCALFR